MQSMSGKIRSGQVRSDEVKSGHVKSGQVKSSQVKLRKSGQVRSGQVRLNQVRSGQVKPGQVKSGQVRSSQVKTGQVKSGHVRSGQVKSGQVMSLCLDTQEEFALPARNYRVEASVSGWNHRLQQSCLAAPGCPACTPAWTRQPQDMRTYRQNIMFLVFKSYSPALRGFGTFPFP